MTFIDKLTVLYYWDIYGWTVLLYLLLLGMNSVATQFIQIQTRFEQFILQIIFYEIILLADQIFCYKPKF